MQVVGKADLQESSSSEMRATGRSSGEKTAVNAAAKNLAIDVFRPEMFAGKSYFAQLKVFEDVCEQVHSKAWEPCSEKLKSFVQARMEKNMAVDLFLGSGAAEQIGGICHGMAEFWNALHAANPYASAISRMALLMTEKGMSLALAAQKVYVAESKKAIYASPMKQQLETISRGEFRESFMYK